MAESTRAEADRIDAQEAEATAAAPSQVEFIEYLGEEPYGTAFIQSHTLPRGDGLWKRNKLQVNKEIVWIRDPNGPQTGSRGNRMLVAVEDLPEGTAEILEKLPQYRRVTD